MSEKAMDNEIKAMAAVSAALHGLEPDEIRRIVRWVNDRYQVKPAAASRADLGTIDNAGQSQPFSEFSELFDAASPTTNVDKALLAAYWFQVIQKHETLDSQQLNSELKHLGHPSVNITRDLDSLINRTPRLIMQVRKEGTTKQARKRYRITREGVRAVETMLTQPSQKDAVVSGDED